MNCLSEAIDSLSFIEDSGVEKNKLSTFVAYKNGKLHQLVQLNKTEQLKDLINEITAN